MALLCSKFRFTVFIFKSTAILGSQVVLRLFHFHSHQNSKNVKLVNGSCAPSVRRYLFRFFSGAGGFADAEDPEYPRCPAPAESLQSKFQKTQFVNLHHFVCAILQMALLSSDFRSIGFFLRSTAILGRQVVLQDFKLKSIENRKKHKLVDGSCAPSVRRYLFRFFSGAGGFADAEDPEYPRCPAPAESSQPKFGAHTTAGSRGLSMRYPPDGAPVLRFFENELHYRPYGARVL